MAPIRGPRKGPGERLIFSKCQPNASSSGLFSKYLSVIEWFFLLLTSWRCVWLRDLGKVEEEVHTIIRCLRKLLACQEFVFGVTGKSSIFLDHFGGLNVADQLKMFQIGALNMDFGLETGVVQLHHKVMMTPGLCFRFYLSELIDLTQTEGKKAKKS